MDSQDNDERTLISKVNVDAMRREADSAVLEQTTGPGAPRAVALEKAATVVGCDEKADVRLDLDGISARHLRLVRLGDGYMCVDQESATGVFVNGVKVHSAALHDGDRIELGAVTFVFHGH